MNFTAEKAPHKYSPLYSGFAVLLMMLCAVVGAKAQAKLQITPSTTTLFAGGFGTCPMPLSGCPATTYANLQSSNDVTVDAAGNVYIVDYSSSVVRIVNTSGIIKTFAGGGTGCPGETDAIGDGCPANTVALNGPYAIAFDPSGNAYVAEGGFVGNITPRIRMITPGGIISTFAGTGVQGYSGDGGSATVATLEEPTGVASDADGNIYIVDLAASVVRMVDLNHKITTVAGGGPVCSGQTDAVGDGCPATNAILNEPYGITVDSSGNLYIADTNNNRIRKVDTTKTITTIAGTGVAGLSGDNGPATTAMLSFPERVIVDEVGNLYISDNGTHIRKIDTTGNITAVAGGGAGCSFTPCSALESTESDGSGYLVGLGIDQAGNLYAGSGDFVQMIGPQGALAFPSTAVPQSSAAETIVLSNLGTSPDVLPANIGGYVLSGEYTDFAFTGGTCLTNNTIAPGASCTLQAVFTPSAAGERSAVATFSDTGAGNPHTITLYGMATQVLPQDINFPQIQQQRYGNQPFALVATASSGLPVTYSIVSGPATISGTTLSITGAGTVIVQADQAGNAAYLPAQSVQQQFLVAKATLTVMANQLERYTNQINPPFLTYTMSGFVLNDTQVSATTGQPVLTTSAPSNTPPGSYVITITQGTLASTNYAFDFVNEFLIVGQAGGTQTTLNLSSQTTTNQQVITLSANVSTEEPIPPGSVTFVTSTGIVLGHAQLVVGQGNASISRTFPPGLYQIIAKYDGTAGYLTSSSAPQTLTVTGTQPTITTLNAHANSTNPTNTDFAATVFGFGTQSPTGSISFNDTTISQSLSSVAPTATTSSFQTLQFSSDTATGQVAVGDFDGDGNLDFATTDHGNIDIFFGNPNGTYSGSVQYPAGTNLQFIAVADFDGDGNLDIVTSDSATGSVVVLYGTGNGYFDPPTTYPIPAPSVPSGIVVADFNGDGYPDIAVSQNNGQNLVTVLINDTNGNFVYPQSFGTGSSQGITVGDFNGDGYPDIASSTGTNVAVMLGNSDGTFQPQINSPASGVSITSGDFNGDGKLDVALANAASVTVALGNGDGTFGSASSYPVSTPAISIATADFNLDGHLDLVASAASAGATGTSILFGVGNGSFQAPLSYPAGGGVGGIAVADVNADNMPDVVTLNPLNETFTVLRGGMVSTASLTNVNILGTGVHQINAAYTPDTNSIYTGSVSNIVSVTAQPIVISSITPQEIAAGTNGLTITVNGTNFNANAVVLTNGVAASTTYVNPTQLTATVSEKFLATTGTIQIQVYSQGYLAAYSSTSNALALAVVPDVALTSVTPALAIAQSAAMPITVSGTNFTPTTVLQFNGAPLATTYTSATQLQAVIPATYLVTAATAQITAFDPVTESQSTSLPFTILPSPAGVFTGPPTANPSTQPGLTFQLSQPYPIALSGTMTLTFQPNQGEPDDPSIQFASGGRTFNFTLPANTSTTPTVPLQAGTVAGTITATLTLTANGVNVTPPNIAPVTITVPKGVPVITQQLIVRSGSTVTIYVTGYSTTRDMANAYFNFTPISGTKFSQSDFTVPVTTLFSTWFSSTPSDQYGSTFTYFQAFTLNNSAADVQSVTVTLENAQGKSQTEVVQ